MQLAWGKSLRIKVLFDITKPLKQNKRLWIKGGEKITTEFKYEYLSDFCYIGGHINHQEYECEGVIRMKKEVVKIERKFGAWIRAEALMKGV